MTTDRSDIRKELAALLSTVLVGGTAFPVEAVYAYQPATFGGKTPVVTVSDAGTQRPPFTHAGGRTIHAFYIHIFVLYADAISGWNESMAEDRLDLIEKTISVAIRNNRIHENYWNLMHQDAPSRAVGVKIGGDEYRCEVLTVLAEVYG